MVALLFWCVLVFLRIEAVVCSTCPDGSDTARYSGNISTTNGGRSCQKWSSQTPHEHTYNIDAYFPIDGSVKEAQSYCRNPDGDSEPWCYTNDPYMRYQYCTGRICHVSDAMCGGEKTDVSGWISYVFIHTTKVFDAIKDCLWKLVGSENSPIEFSVISMESTSKISCYYNYLQVYEPGFNYGKFCTNDTVPVIVSKTNVLYVRFFCYFCETRLNATYAQLKLPPGLTVRNPHCGGLVNESKGSISSPDRDEDGLYQPVEDCHWTLTGKPSTALEVTVIWMDIEVSAECNKDFLQIYEASKSHGKFCGDATPHIISESNILNIRFVSDLDGVGQGFYLAYDTYIDGSTPTEGSHQKHSSTTDQKTPSTEVLSNNIIMSTPSTSGRSCETMESRIVRLTAIVILLVMLNKLNGFIYSL